MRWASHALITVGFLVGALGTVLEADNVVRLPYYVPGIVLCVTGVFLARYRSRQETRSEENITGNVEQLREALDRIVENVQVLDAGKGELNPYDAHGRIDELFPQHLNQFVDARHSMAHVFGLQAYADVMNEFAAGERYLNRVWSASVDGYIDEVREYIGRARDQFVEAQRKLTELLAGSA